MQSLKGSKETGQVDFTPLKQLIEEAFVIPQLGKTRRIWALLPHDYATSEKRYPVLYLQDAQNLFDNKGPFGNWEIDRHMAEMAKAGKGDFIVIAIDHGGKERIKEYSPYRHRSFGSGEGKKYAAFIIDTLKPYVDKTFRTLPEREYTGIGGSSMGGLISAYIGIKYPEHFSRLMIFSPSFWYSDKIYFDAFNYQYTLPTKIFIYAGEKESPFMTRHIHRFKRAIRSGNFVSTVTRFKIKINPDGQHQEHFWGEEFQEAVEWLFF